MRALTFSLIGLLAVSLAILVGCGDDEVTDQTGPGDTPTDTGTPTGLDGGVLDGSTEPLEPDFLAVIPADQVDLSG